MTRWLLLGASVVVAGVAAVAFVFSFGVQADYAVRVGVASRDMAWAIPLSVDGAMVAAGLLGVALARAGLPARPASALSLVALGASLAMNVAHAPVTPAAQAVALIPPVFMGGSVHQIWFVIRAVAARQEESTDDGDPADRVGDAGGDLADDTDAALTHEQVTQEESGDDAQGRRGTARQRPAGGDRTVRAQPEQGASRAPGEEATASAPRRGHRPDAGASQAPREVTHEQVRQAVAAAGSQRAAARELGVSKDKVRRVLAAASNGHAP